MANEFVSNVSAAPEIFGKPVFEYIPVVSGVELDLSIARIIGISTKHDSIDTDRGRMYAKASDDVAGVRLDIYRRYSLDAADLVMTGTGALGTLLTLAEQNASGMTGEAIVRRYVHNSVAIILPTFAVDSDVSINPAFMQNMPGWDEGFGFAFFHAYAMKVILTDSLPAAIPNLYPDGLAMAFFTPMANLSIMPDLRKLANPDQLRIAQVHLVKALSAEQGEHIEEMRLIGEAARARYEAAMENINLAIVKDERQNIKDEPGSISVSVGAFQRLFTDEANGD